MYLTINGINKRENAEQKQSNQKQSEIVQTGEKQKEENKQGEEKQQVEIKAEEKELKLEDNEYMHVETDASGNKVPVPEPSKIYGTDANGKKWGKLYNFSTTLGEEVTGASAYNWNESNGVMTIKAISGSNNNSYREPDVLKDRDRDSSLKTLSLGAKTMHEFSMQIEREFEKAIKSIEKYGGYYIGRYETGGLNGTAKIVKGDTNIADQTWYTMYKKSKELAGENSNIETGLIWGCEQDRVLMWLIESGNKTKEQVCKDSIDWGNYYNNAIEYVNSSGSVVTTTAGSSTRIPAGSNEQTKANNIYDLAGNVSEWGMEADSAGYRSNRGGFYNSISNGYPASYRGNDNPTNTNGNRGCRAILYIR